MKIVTWNANMAFRNKIQKINLHYNPDVLVVQECEKSCNQDIYTYHLWHGENVQKGISIFSKFPIEEVSSDIEDIKYFIVCNIESYTVIGLWAMNDNINKSNRYVGQVWNFITRNEHIFTKNIIILGDFNWNFIWDNNPDYPLSGNMRNVIDFLNRKGIQSLYHNQHNEVFGQESTPTFFMHRNQDKYYHIDYIFLDSNIKVKKFNIGKKADWLNYSDHMPLFAEIE